MDSEYISKLRRQRAFSAEPTPSPSLLPLQVRIGLHEQGYTEVHQSDIVAYSKCGAAVKFKTQQRSPIYPANFLLGSVLHLALEQECESEAVTERGMHWKFWLDLFQQVRARDPNATFLFQGAPLTREQVETWCRGFCRADYWGVPLANLVILMMAEIKHRGWTVVQAEQQMDFVDGDDTNGGFPIVFQGTLDLLLYSAQENAWCIQDMKSYGLWGPLGISAKEKAANKVSFDDQQIRFSRQMRHYHWMKSKVDRSIAITHYGFAAPTNAVPYKTNGEGRRAGDPKGPVTFITTGLGQSFINDYERNLVATLTMMSQGHFPKFYPEEYGKTTCLRCPYFRACTGAPEVQGLADVEGYDD